MVATSGMNNRTLDLLLQQRLPDLEGDSGSWRTSIDDLTLYILTDEMHDRIRIMIPIAEIETGDCDLMSVLLHANFDRTLDARYGIDDGLVFSMFLHPLSQLTEAILDNALSMVITLAQNTGSSFASSDLLFKGSV